MKLFEPLLNILVILFCCIYSWVSVFIWGNPIAAIGFITVLLIQLVLLQKND